jgi:uncharacterized protein YjbI with pentapeptide repeats
MSDQNGAQRMALKRPANDDKDGWKAYWKVQAQSWRREPEIDAERQKHLAVLRSIVPDITNGIYPFSHINLNRADVEWLLATHEGLRGPIDWSDKSQRDREGLDLRGANLRGLDLSGLPLAGMIAGLFIEGEQFTGDELEASASHMEGVNFKSAHLEGVGFNNTHLERANFRDAHLEGADFAAAHLEGANLMDVKLEGATFIWAHLEGAYLQCAYLEGADLRGAFFDASTKLNGIVLHNEKYSTASLADIHWSDANIAVVDWSTISILGDEHSAKRGSNDEVFGVPDVEYTIATRVYRQLSVVLRNQGLSEDANRFAYRAQLMQRKVFWHQRKMLHYLGSLFLALLSGYGYKPIRSFLAYLIVILAFATTYFILGRTVGPALSPLGSVVFSMTSFHGRGFFPGGITLDDPLTVLAALEAFIGLLIEVTFIATLTRRLFGG